jgi:hypothetical protein
VKRQVRAGGYPNLTSPVMHFSLFFKKKNCPVQTAAESVRMMADEGDTRARRMKQLGSKRKEVARMKRQGEEPGT